MKIHFFILGSFILCLLHKINANETQSSSNGLIYSPSTLDSTFKSINAKRQSNEMVKDPATTTTTTTIMNNKGGFHAVQGLLKTVTDLLEQIGLGINPNEVLNLNTLIDELTGHMTKLNTDHEVLGDTSLISLIRTLIGAVDQVLCNKGHDENLTGKLDMDGEDDDDDDDITKRETSSNDGDSDNENEDEGSSSGTGDGKCAIASNNTNFDLLGQVLGLVKNLLTNGQGTKGLVPNVLQTITKVVTSVLGSSLPPPPSISKLPVTNSNTSPAKRSQLRRALVQNLIEKSKLS
ncbi:hypothetical protein BJ944DRAFT_253355 [Cunninghamella echinulata]|nr:hypothetical protein BJ944DRAFT_253355 [Cunninghamella echinulata]